MTKELTNIKRMHSIRKRLIVFSLLLFVGLELFSGCSIGQKNYLSKTTLMSDSNPVDTDEIIPTPTQNLTMINSTQIVPTPAKTMNPTYDLNVTLDVTQGPVVISTTSPEAGDYLYKDANATVKFFDQFEATSYLNLDNLAENGMKNSDIEIDRSIGSEVNYSLIPINNAYYYLSSYSTLDYNSCIQHFPITGFTSEDYMNQAFGFIYGKSYCILTNEGRIAIVNYEKDSLKHLGDSFEEELSIKVTTFQN
jgi:hypothetical protein